ncbi:ARM repeat superfamily protein [Wolffia australiana]
MVSMFQRERERGSESCRTMAERVEGEEDGKQLALKIARILDECRLSQAVHQRKLRELSAIRSTVQFDFFSSFIRALTPLFEVSQKTASAERIVRFISAFAVRGDGKSDRVSCNAFLLQFMRFLHVAAQAAKKGARLRACQIISQILLLLSDDADVSDEVWDDVIESMKERVEDKVPEVRICAVRALSRFANDEESSDIVDLLLRALSQESSAEVRKTILLSLPPSNYTSASVISRTLDVHESVRKAAYGALASKFPLQSLSIKLRTLVLQRGLTDRSPSVKTECLKMLKEVWLAKCCDGDPIALLRYLDVETYESVGETVMEALLKDGAIQIHEGQSIRQFLSSKSDNPEGEKESMTGVQLMEPEVAFYWRTVCRHLQVQAEAKGSDAAATTGAEAAVYASEATMKNDLLESVLPACVSHYIALVNAHLSAGPNMRFSSRQLLLLGATLDFSDAVNRTAAGGFVRGLLCRPLDHDVDEMGEKVLIGDGISLGGDRDWCGAVAALAKKVHAAAGEFEEVVAAVAAQLARPCRERTADAIGWSHCLAVAGLLLENAASYRTLAGRAIEPAELLSSLLLPAAKHVHVDVQRAATRCLGLFGLLESRPSEELVKQLRLAFVGGASAVRVMACRALLDLVTWHGPDELDRAIGPDPDVGLLDLLYAGLGEDEVGPPCEPETVQGVLGEGFSKILLLHEHYPSISPSLQSLILGRLIRLYFFSESKDLDRLKQCLSVFFDHFPALSEANKACISRAFVPVMRSTWPGVNGGAGVGGAQARKRAVNVSRFMLQLMQTPLRAKAEEKEYSPGESTFDVENGEEGLAIRIATEVGGFAGKRSAAGRAYAAALCRIVPALKFRSSQQEAIKFMGGLLGPLTQAMKKDKELARELAEMAAELRSLDRTPGEDLPAETAAQLRQRLQLDEELPAATGRRGRAVRAASSSSSSSSSSEDERVYYTPAAATATAPRPARRSKTVAMSRMTARDDEDDSDVTSADESVID